MSTNDIYLIDPVTKEILKKSDNLFKTKNGKIIAKIKNGIPRFVESTDDYAKNFGFQWNYWDEILSDNRSTKDHKYNLIIDRTRFDKLDIKNKTILECGCGGGDDTEVLLKLPFKKVYSFDISNAVDRAKNYLSSDKRLELVQASILEIPYPDESFDFVFCHRVLQHTPDPLLSLNHIMTKIKPGGILFIHSYHKTKNYMKNYKYKYRFITKRMPQKWLMNYVNSFGVLFHYLNTLMYKNKHTRNFSYRFIPFEYYKSYQDFDKKKLIELEKLVTFDALSPKFDKPITWKQLEQIVTEKGFEILYANRNPEGSPIYLTARKIH